MADIGRPVWRFWRRGGAWWPGPGIGTLAVAGIFQVGSRCPGSSARQAHGARPHYSVEAILWKHSNGW